MFGFGGRDTRRTPGDDGIDHHANTVDIILEEIGLDPAQARLETEEGYGWSFRRGSATIEIYLAELGDTGYLQVLSPIVHLPSTNILPMYRRLLELNLQLTNAALGVYSDTVYVFYERPIEGLDAVEANSIISQVASYADDLDDKLIAEFGGRLYNQA